MKRFFPTSLALLLVMASFGHVLAAAFCPRALGRECCFAKTANHTHGPSSGHANNTASEMHVDGMPMDGMNMDDMAMGDTSMDHNAMDDMVVDSPSADMAIPFGEEAVANRIDQPVESCAHCLGHSGIVNAPVSSVNVSDQSGKDVASVLLPVAKFPGPPAIALAQSGLPREHAPPNSSVPRHILVSVFLI